MVFRYSRPICHRRFVRTPLRGLSCTLLSLGDDRHPSQTTIRPSIKQNTHTHINRIPLPRKRCRDGVVICHLDVCPPCRTFPSGIRENHPCGMGTNTGQEHMYKTGTKTIHKTMSKIPKSSPYLCATSS